mgnify:CR=1 FL=1
MGTRRDQITGKQDGVCVPFDEYRLMVRRVAWGAFHAHAGNNAAVAISPDPFNRTGETIEVGGEVAGAHDGASCEGIVKLASLHDVYSIWENWRQLAISRRKGTSAVIEVQVGEQYVCDVFKGNTCCCEVGCKRDRDVYGEDVTAVCIEAITAAGIDQHRCFASPDQQASTGICHSVAFVWRRGTLP